MQKTINLKEKVYPLGIITIRQYKAGTKELVGKYVDHNLIMQGTNTGLDLIIQRLIGTNTYSLNVNYGAFGTGSTVATVNDTQLETETVRVAVGDKLNITHNTARFKFFFPDAVLANGTLREFGMFIDGTSSANSGKIFDRIVLASPYIKTSGIDTSVQVDIVLSQ